MEGVGRAIVCHFKSRSIQALIDAALWFFQLRNKHFEWFEDVNMLRIDSEHACCLNSKELLAGTHKLPLKEKNIVAFLCVLFLNKLFLSKHSMKAFFFFPC